MKPILLTFLLVLKLSLAYTFGSVIGLAGGIPQPEVVGYIFVAGAFFASLPKHAAADGVDVSAIATQLGQYVFLNKTKIWTTLKQGLEWEQFMTKVPNWKGKSAYLNSTQSEVTQPYQSAWTPKGTATWHPYISESFHMKIDYALGDMNNLYDGWVEFMSDETKERKDWPFVRWIIDESIIPKVMEELNIISARGVYAAPTPGTAGGFMTSADGHLSIITREITAGNLVPIVTGAITTSNAVDKTELFLDTIPELETLKGGTVFMSKGNAKKYMRNYRTLFGSTNSKDSKGNLKMDDFEINVQGVAAFGSSQRMLFTPKENLLLLYDKIAVPNQISVQQNLRVVSLLSDFWRGYGFGTLQRLYVNDQP